MIDIIKQKLICVADIAATKASEAAQPEAAVLLAVTDEPVPNLILTRRAVTLSSHAGEVAFPGGKKDLQDADLVATALRESHEEIGLPPAAVEVLGALPAARSKFGIQVTPVVGLISPQQPLTANPEELDHIFTVPLDYFLQSPTDIYEASYKQQRFKVPCYRYQDNIIWGLTAYFIVEFMNLVFDANIRIQMRAEATPKADE